MQDFRKITKNEYLQKYADQYIPQEDIAEWGEGLEEIYKYWEEIYLCQYLACSDVFHDLVAVKPINKSLLAALMVSPDLNLKSKCHVKRIFTAGIMMLDLAREYMKENNLDEVRVVFSTYHYRVAYPNATILIHIQPLFALIKYAKKFNIKFECVRSHTNKRTNKSGLTRRVVRTLAELIVPNEKKGSYATFPTIQELISDVDSYN